ncbi:MAG: DUF2207 domain-containing protein, partial [Thermoproteota archaeon]
MSERRQIFLLVGLTLAIALSAVILIISLPQMTRSEDFVENYKAIFYPNGTLIEKYTYHLRTSGHKFLYRTWEAPISSENIGEAYIEPIQVEVVRGAVGYYKDYRGRVFVEEPYRNDEKIINRIENSALRNELGSYYPHTYQPGIYHLKFVFILHPPIEIEEDIAHLNLQLANRHIPYRNVEILFKEARYIQEIYPHPPSLKVKTQKKDLLVTGSSGENSLLEVEMLISPGVTEELEGFQSEVDN